MNREKVWVKLIQNKKEELAEIEKIVQPKKFWGKVIKFFRHHAILNVMILDIKIKYLKLEVKILKQYNREGRDDEINSCKQNTIW